ncbi:MAG: S-layer homology domain-containing protein [Cohnella sp.]|nr:S-layer homology domain-containing protein [Cohnella sp.]
MNGINVDPNYRGNYVKLAATNRDLYAVWQESYNGTTTFKIRVKKYNGITGWTSAEAGSGGLLAEPSRSAEFPVITTLNNTVFVAWHEKNSSNELLRAANYTPPAVNSVTVTPDTATVRQGESRQLNVTVDAVGGAATTVDWTSSDMSNKVTVTGTGKVTVAADAVLSDYTITATSTADGSKKGTATITVTEGLAVEATPAAEVDYVAEQLTGLEPNGDYDVDGTSVSADGSGKVAIVDGWLGKTVNVVKKGNGTTTTDSLPQTLSLPARPATPTAGKTDETAIGGNNGTLTSVTTAMEYKKGATGSWTEIAGTRVTGLAPDTYYVRVKATSSAFASNPQTVTIATFNASSEATPAAEVDYVAEQLTGLEPNGDYDIDGTTVSADGSGKVAIVGGWLGKTVSVVKKGNGTTTTDSSPQTLSLPVRPAAPVDVSVTDITYNGANDGSIVNVNAAMEYRKGNTGSWTRATGTSVDGLETGVYYVRVAATESSLASVPAQVTIHDSNASIPEAPIVSADDTNNAIVGLDTTMEFSVDGGTYIRYDGTNAPRLEGDHTVQVRVAASGSVPAGPSTTLSFTTNVAVPADGLTVTASDPRGAAYDGTTKITVTPDTEDGYRLVYFNFGSDTVAVPNSGDTLSGYLYVPGDGMIPAANGDHIGVAVVDSLGRVVRFGQTAASVIAEPPAPPIVIETPTRTTGSNEETVNVLVNGKVENAGKAITTESGGIKTTTVVVDPVKLQAKLEAEGANAVVTIPVKSDSNVIVGELNGLMVKKMEAQSATLVLQTDKATYTLPAHEIAIDEVARKLGGNVKLEDIHLRISVANTPETMAQVVENAAAKGEFSVVAPALDFTVTGTYGGNTVEVTSFNAYVERMVILPEGSDPSKMTTGIVVEPDGTVRHVPTQIVLVENRYYAKINSLTNSTYSVIWHPLEFMDVANHWAKAAVNDMGSRMVIDGTGDGRFSPDRAITRAEFAAILVRGLGLKLEDNRPTEFSDVKVSDWFGSSINTAYAYELINGYDDGTFRPNDEITREEAMAILSRATSITGLKDKTSAQSIDLTLQPYRDASNVSGWARSSVAINVQAGLVSGRSTSVLAPLASITRAEAATMIRRLLQTSELIN